MTFQSPSVKAVLHAFKVAATIAGSMLLTGAGIYFSNPQNLTYFGQAFEHWGVPVAVVNVIVAAVMKYLSEHNKPNAFTIDSFPDGQQLPPQA